MSDKKYDGHTPGPWAWDGMTEEDAVLISEHAGAGDVLSGIIVIENKMDARLIACAPLLLKQRDEGIRLFKEILADGHSEDDDICKCLLCRHAKQIKAYLKEAADETG